MEELLFLALRTFAGIFLWITVDFLFYTLCYYIGWAVCKITTLGRFPSNAPHKAGLVKGFSDRNNFVPTIGLLITIVMIVLAALL